MFSAVEFNEGIPGYDRVPIDVFLTELGAKVEELQELWRVTHEQRQEVSEEARLAAAAASVAVERRLLGTRGPTSIWATDCEI